VGGAGFFKPGEEKQAPPGMGFEGQFEAQDVVLHCDAGEFPIEAGKTIEDFYKNRAIACLKRNLWSGIYD